MSETPSARHGSVGQVVEGRLERGRRGSRAGTAAARTRAVIRSRRPSTGDRGPQISSVTLSSHSGAKKRRPSRWSRWRWVRKRWICRVPRRTRSRPSARMPVPASSTSADFVLRASPRRRRYCRRTSTVSDPGRRNRAATPPDLQPHRHPLSHARRSRRCRRTRPCVQTGERGHFDFALDAVRACHEIPKVRCAALVERDPRRPTLRRDRLRRERPRLKGGEPVIETASHPSRRIAADNRLGRLVVEDQIPTRIGDQRRRRQVRGKLARQDQDKMLLPLRVHVDVAPWYDPDTFVPRR